MDDFNFQSGELPQLTMPQSITAQHPDIQALARMRMGLQPPAYQNYGVPPPQNYPMQQLGMMGMMPFQARQFPPSMMPNAMPMNPMMMPNRFAGTEFGNAMDRGRNVLEEIRQAEQEKIMRMRNQRTQNLDRLDAIEKRMHEITRGALAGGY